jgi:Zn-dependent alcohol dehydrogenase
MQTENLIALDEFCANHSIEISFITSLQRTGLVEIKTIKESVFIDADQLRDLEKMVRLFYELDINLEGIETITYLLQRINSLQNEIIELKNRLRFYETTE